MPRKTQTYTPTYTPNPLGPHTFIIFIIFIVFIITHPVHTFFFDRTIPNNRICMKQCEDPYAKLNQCSIGCPFDETCTVPHQNFFYCSDTSPPKYCPLFAKQNPKGGRCICEQGSYVALNWDNAILLDPCTLPDITCTTSRPPASEGKVIPSQYPDPPTSNAHLKVEFETNPLTPTYPIVSRISFTIPSTQNHLITALSILVFPPDISAISKGGYSNKQGVGLQLRSELFIDPYSTSKTDTYEIRVANPIPTKSVWLVATQLESETGEYILPINTINLLSEVNIAGICKRYAPFLQITQKQTNFENLEFL